MWLLVRILLLVGTLSPIELTEREARIVQRMSPVPHVPADPSNAVADRADAATLGANLFKSRAFSSSGQVSCSSCHSPASGFDDGRALARGEADGTRNAPTLIGAAHQRWFFWDGRADSLWGQALHPFENASEFNSSRVDAVRTLWNTPALAAGYRDLFGPLPDMDDTDRYPPGARPDTPAWLAMADADKVLVTRAFVNMGKSIAAFERTIPVGTSRFDAWVQAVRKGRQADIDTLLSTQERRGLTLFIGSAGCRNCHSGPLFSDRAFHNIGLPASTGLYPTDPGRAAGLELAKKSEFSLSSRWSDAPHADAARRAANATAGPEHWGAIRTPSLRNLTVTGPYMHDGRFESISQVLAFYNTLEDQVAVDHHQELVLQPLNLDHIDLEALEAFLRTLLDETAAPSMSKNGPAMPTHADPRLDLPE